MSKVLVSNEAAATVEGLPKRARARVAATIDGLEEDPISHSHLLKDTDYGTGLRVMRAGSHRIIFSVDHETSDVTILTVS